MNVRLISVTRPFDVNMDAQELLAYCARVSNPSNQGNHGSADRLLKYCAKHGHWSVFEMADMTVEIETSRAIAAQILRHRSFSFQEFSQRYSEVMLDYDKINPRRQDTKNRQNSFDDLDPVVKKRFARAQKDIWELAKKEYDDAIKWGVAKECARMLLPLSTMTRLYMKGSVRSWIHYCQVRCEASTQVEHREIANECKKLLLEEFPFLADIWSDE